MDHSSIPEGASVTFQPAQAAKPARCGTKNTAPVDTWKYTGFLQQDKFSIRHIQIKSIDFPEQKVEKINTTFWLSRT